MSDLVAVTGCGKSGTHWAAEMLTTLGHPCLHEEQFGTDQHGPLRESESSWLMVPFIEKFPLDVKLAWVVRNPYDVVKSAIRMEFLRFTIGIDNPYSRFTREHCPYAAKGADHLTRVIRYVATWDEGIARLYGMAILYVDGDTVEQRAVLSWLLDRPVPDNEFRAASRRVGRPNPSPKLRQAPTVGQINSHPEGHLIKSRAKALGYL